MLSSPPRPPRGRRHEPTTGRHPPFPTPGDLSRRAGGPAAQGGGNRRRDAPHQSAPGPAPCARQLRARRQDRRSLRLWRRARRLVDPRRAGTASRRRHPRARHRRLAAGTDARTARHRLLHPRPRLGLRSALAFDPRSRPPRQAPGLCARRRQPSLVLSIRRRATWRSSNCAKAPGRSSPRCATTTRSPRRRSRRSPSPSTPSGPDEVQAASSRR